MTTLGREIALPGQARGIIPWLLGAVFLLYMVGYIDGSVHVAAIAGTGFGMDYVHEFFHHARHVALMCH